MVRTGTGFMTMVAVVMALAMALGTQVADAQETPTVSTDRTGYLGNDFAVITLSGAQACAGREVQLGLDFGDFDEASRWATVDSEGTATVELQLWLRESTGHAFANAPCLPDQRITGNTVAIEEFFPDFTVTGLFVDFEDSRTVTVQGLLVCAGQEILLGVAGAPLAPVAVDASGGATVQVPLVEGPWWPVIEGDCVPGGRYLQDQTPDGVWIDNVPGIRLGFGSDANVYKVGDTANVSVYGLGACVDQTAVLGLFSPEGGLLRGLDVSVSDYGSGSADIVVPGNAAVAYVGVTGDCLDGEVLLSDEPISIQRDVPMPPDVGTGLVADDGATVPLAPIVAVAGLITGLAAARLVRRVR